MSDDEERERFYAECKRKVISAFSSIPSLRRERREGVVRNEKMKILDAGRGKQGFFTLVSEKNCLFIHYNKGPEGYAVFQLKGTDEQQARAINRHLAGVIEKSNRMEGGSYERSTTS